MNWLEHPVECPRLADATVLTRLSLRPEECLQGCVSDLPDYFTVLGSGPAHVPFNPLGREWTAAELRQAGVEVAQDVEDDTLCQGCLRDIAMGDHKAVAVAQTVHAELLHRGGCARAALA